MNNRMSSFRFYLWGILSHLGIVLSLMFFVFLIVDRYNRAMAFVNNDITKALLLSSAVIVLALSRLSLKSASAYSKRAKALLYDLFFFGSMFSMAMIFIYFLDFEIMIINKGTVKVLITLFSAFLLFVSTASAMLHRKTDHN